MTPSKRKRRTEYRLKRIVVSQYNYLALKRLGQAGDSFNDVISKLLIMERNLQEEEAKKEEQEHDPLRQQQQGEERSNDYNNNPTRNVIIEAYPSHLIDEVVKQQRQNIADIM